MNKKRLFWFSLVTGLVTLGVGVGIFVFWWLARAWFAIDLSTLEVYGLFWIFISIPFALIGLITSIIVISVNSGKYRRQGFIPLIVLLINMPAVYLILNLQSDISERVYFKVFNRSGKNFKTVKLISNSFEAKLGEIENNESHVDNYIPTYLSREFDSVPEVEEITLELSNGSELHQLKMPYSMKGECKRFIITDSLTIKLK